MAHLVFSLSGEGRGHATRVRAVVEHLREQHRITLFAPADAFDFLAPLYATSEVRVRAIPGLRFHYDQAGRLDYRRTAQGAASYVRALPRLIKGIQRELEREPVDLVVADFEPALPRAARRSGIPFISLSHQHFLLTYDLSGLPRSLRWHAAYMRWIVRAYYSGQRHSIVSSFYFPPLRRRCRNVTQVGVLLRPELRQTPPAGGDHLVAYLRRFAGPNVLEALAAAGRPVRVYGLGERPACGPLTFHAISETRFIADLAGCAALVATAGNQLVGEALFLGKPCFVMPEARNFEQFINAHFLAQTGAGTWLELDRVTPAALRAFVRDIDQFAARIERRRLDGLPATLRAIDRFLPDPVAATAQRPKARPLPAHLVPEPSA
jgi:uncharacterized protein (TIGR00661 family)